MEQLLKVGEKQGSEIEVDKELSDFEKRLQFTKQEPVQFEDSKFFKLVMSSFEKMILFSFSELWKAF